MNVKTCLITGATSGIGKASAFALAEAGNSLILTGRNMRRGKSVISSLKSKFKNQNFQFIAADLSSIRQVIQLADVIKLKYQVIDVLINNAGARFNKFQKSEDGIELTFATNHLGHFMLTLLILELIKKSSSGRIINVSSSAHGSSSAEFTMTDDSTAYNRKNAYADSKLANLLFTYELADKVKESGVTVNAVNPGGVLTNLGKNNGYIAWLKHIVYHLFKRELQLPSDAADTIVYLADSPEVAGITGKYFYKKKEIKSSPYSYNKETAAKLWNLSTRLCKMDFPVIL